jgi:hypothetical protein
VADRGDDAVRAHRLQRARQWRRVAPWVVWPLATAVIIAVGRIEHQTWLVSVLLGLAAGALAAVLGMALVRAYESADGVQGPS